MGVHARKGASGAKRWMACPGSLVLSEGCPNESSEAAMQGTAAHHLGETCLKEGCDAEKYMGWTIVLDEEEECVLHEKFPMEELFSATAIHKAIFPVDANMVDAVQIYLNAVRDEVERLGAGAELAVEQHCDLSWLRPEMFGTNDSRVLQLFDELSVLDYKHGQGVTVEVKDWIEIVGPGGPTGVYEWVPNIQLVYYAIGAAQACDWAFEKVTITVVQPRKAHHDGPVRSFTFRKADLLVYAAQLGEASDVCDRAADLFRKIQDEQDQADWEAEFLHAGDHCQFCPGKYQANGLVCPELERQTYREAEIDFAEDGSISCAVMDEGVTDAKLERAMRVIPILDVYIKATETEAMRRLRSSEDGTGFEHKLVRKRSIRRWADGVTAEDIIAKGFPQGDLYQPPKMKSPTQVEALRPPDLMASLKAAKVKAPAQAIKALVAELAIKPEGGITIAHSTDPRPAVAPSAAAASDFDVVEED